MSARMTAAQATVKFLRNQFSARDGKEYRFFGGCLGIFGHGNVAGIGQALEQDSRTAVLPISQRARDGSCGLGICESKFPDEDTGLHNFGGPGRNKHGDGSGGWPR